jgi:hypothetical protein
MKYFLLLILTVLTSCSLMDIFFGPYDKNKYCSQVSMDILKKARENFEIPKKSINDAIVNFYYENDEKFEKCFKDYTVSKVKARHYCTVVKLKKRKKKNKILYIGVDNLVHGVQTELRECIEKEIENIKNLELGEYNIVSVHFPLLIKK